MIELMELTVPFEDNLGDAHFRKEVRYDKLVKYCREAGWTAWHNPIEVGCRGFVGTSVRRWCRNVGFTSKEAAKLLKDVQEAAERASHWVWLKRNDDTWIESQ